MPGRTINVSPRMLSHRWRVQGALLRWLGFHAKMVVFYLFCFMFLAQVAFFFDEALTLLWAIWYHFQDVPPVIPL